MHECGYGYEVEWLKNHFPERQTFTQIRLEDVRRAFLPQTVSLSQTLQQLPTTISAFPHALVRVAERGPFNILTYSFDIERPLFAVFANKSAFFLFTRSQRAQLQQAGALRARAVSVPRSRWQDRS